MDHSITHPARRGHVRGDATTATPLPDDVLRAYVWRSVIGFTLLFWGGVAILLTT